MWALVIYYFYCIAIAAVYFKVKISPWYDGRQDVIDSTRAALDFMEYLYKRFDGNWYHAIAAYNLGEGRVLKSNT